MLENLLLNISWTIFYCFYCNDEEDTAYLFEDRISNGTQALSGDFPYIVSVAYQEAHHCGGFVYNEKFIVTVASCVYEFVRYG